MGIDNVFHDFMVSIESNWLTNFSKFIATITEPIVLLILSFIIAGLIYFKRSKLQGIFFASLIIATGIFIKASKLIFQRVRPLGSLVTETNYAFPSGHATMAMVFFGIMFYLLVKRKTISNWIAVSLLIILIGFTRVYLRAHWLTDVLGGYVFGAIILGIGITIYKRIRLKIE